MHNTTACNQTQHKVTYKIYILSKQIYSHKANDKVIKTNLFNSVAKIARYNEYRGNCGRIINVIFTLYNYTSTKHYDLQMNKAN